MAVVYRSARCRGLHSLTPLYRWKQEAFQGDRLEHVVFQFFEATSLGRIFWWPRLQELGTLVSKLLFVLSLHLLVTKLSPPHLLALLT